ncbi:MAG: hypothetical protein OCD01_11680 [Fibrobacterales bacterium]
MIHTTTMISKFVTIAVVSASFFMISCSSDLDNAKNSAIKTLECLEVVLSDNAPKDEKDACIKHNEKQKALEDKLTPDDKEEIARFYVEKFKEMQEERK